MAALNRKLLYYLALALLWLYDDGDEEEDDDAYQEPVTVPWVAGVNEMSPAYSQAEPDEHAVPFLQPVLLVVLLLFVFITAPIIVESNIRAHAAASQQR